MSDRALAIGPGHTDQLLCVRHGIEFPPQLSQTLTQERQAQHRLPKHGSGQRLARLKVVKHQQCSRRESLGNMGTPVTGYSRYGNKDIACLHLATIEHQLSHCRVSQFWRRQLRPAVTERCLESSNG